MRLIQEAETRLPFVSIIIVNYNGKHHLSDSLSSIEKLDYPKGKYEAILVDNGSTDKSIDYVTNNFPNLRVLRLDKNYGFCKPNNEGAKIAKGSYLVFLNNDTVVCTNWLRELVVGAMSEASIKCCASKILYYDNKCLLQAAGGKITVIGGGFYTGYGDYDRPAYNKRGYTGFGCCAGVLVEKKFFIDINGFDEDYFATCEEHELGLRIWMNGYKVLYVPTAVMYHKESGTFGKKGSFQPMKIYLITRNRLYNIVKNFQLTNVLKGILIGTVFDSYRFTRYLFSRDSASTKSVLKAYIDFAKNIEKMLKKRSFVQNRRNRSDKELYKLNVIASFKEGIIEERRLLKVLKSPFYKS